MDEYNEFLKNGYTPEVDSTPDEVFKPISTPAPTSAPIIKATEKVRAGGVRLSPAARHISESQYLNISSVIGTSKGGLISKSDIINAVKNGIATPSPNKALAKSVATSVITNFTTVPQFIVSSDPNDQLPVNNKYIDIPNSKMRKIIAKRLTESKATVPHFYTTIECEIYELLALRKTLKKDLGVNISVNDIVIKSVALALRDVNAVNNKWNKEKSSPEVYYSFNYFYINIINISNLSIIILLAFTYC
jgi:pyruvate dehydrogenase E2 component (dihydrolipoamide acetyltransferase)